MAPRLLRRHGSEEHTGSTLQHRRILENYYEEDDYARKPVDGDSFIFSEDSDSDSSVADTSDIESLDDFSLHPDASDGETSQAESSNAGSRDNTKDDHSTCSDDEPLDENAQEFETRSTVSEDEEELDSSPSNASDADDLDELAFPIFLANEFNGRYAFDSGDEEDHRQSTCPKGD